MSEEFQRQDDDLLLKSLGELAIGPTGGMSIPDEMPDLKSGSDKTDSSLGSPLFDTGQITSEDPTICPYCNRKYRKPRVLDCLHSMCEDCIVAQLDGRNQKFHSNKYVELELEHNLETRPTPPGVIRCPTCSQETHIGNDPMFVKLMLLDYIRIREYGIGDSFNGGKICQACKSEEKALANCIHCVADLCFKCIQAHHEMKLFDGHKVIMFDDKEKTEEMDMNNSVNQHLKLTLAVCEKHKAEYEHICPQCDELLCQYCSVDHIDHNCSPLNETVHKWYKKKIDDLVKQAEAKTEATLEARSAIPQRVDLLQKSYEKCLKKIEDAFQFYARVLNETKLDLLTTLESTREDKEKYLDQLYKNIDKQTEKMEDALRYTKDLVDKATVVELCLNQKKVWQQLKLLMHSMPDVNPEVDLDYEILPEQDFKLKLNSVVGGIKCRTTGIPKEVKSANALLGPANKFEGVLGELDQPSFITGWDSPSANTTIVQQHISQGPGAIGMERRMNRNSTNGTSYLSGDSGICSASDTISSPVSNQLNNSLDAFNTGRFSTGTTDSFGTGYRTPTANYIRSPLEMNQQFDTGMVEPYFGNTSSKIWSANYSSQNLFGNYDHQAAQRPRELFGMSEFPALGTDPSGLRSRSSLCTTPSIDNTAYPQLPISHFSHQQPYTPNISTRTHFGGTGAQQQLEMNILYTFGGDLKNQQDTFNTPQGLALGLDNEIAIADTNNHRCVIVDYKGNFLRQIGSSGTEEGHVYYPKKVVSIIRNRDCRFIVLDRGTNQQFNRLQFFKNNGEFISRLALPCPVDQVSVMAVNKENEQLIIVDNKNLILVFNFEAFNQLTLVRQFSISGNVHEPSDIGIYKDHYYITDYKMHLIAVYSFEGKIVTKFGGLEITPYPVGIDFSKTGDILVGDSHGNHFHIVVFNNQGQPQHHYRCYQQKVSRCTGLKINSDGHIVTMSRQNSAVIVFSTLYIPST